MVFAATLHRLDCHRFRQPQFMQEKGIFPVSEFKAACLAAEAAIELLDLASTNEERDLSIDAVRETFLFTQEIFNLTRKLDPQDVCRFHAIQDIAKKHLIQL